MIKNTFVIFYSLSFIFAMTGKDLVKLMDDRNNPKDVQSTITMQIKNHNGKIRKSTIKSISKNNLVCCNARGV